MSKHQQQLYIIWGLIYAGIISSSTLIILIKNYIQHDKIPTTLPSSR
jgi:hypothetical protein